jgi:hypothetical protein
MVSPSSARPCCSNVQQRKEGTPFLTAVGPHPVVKAQRHLNRLVGFARCGEARNDVPLVWIKVELLGRNYGVPKATKDLLGVFWDLPFRQGEGDLNGSKSVKVLVPAGTQ